MTEILNDLRNERPDMNSEQLKVIFTLLLDRVYNQKEAHVQEQVCNFFADELKLLLLGANNEQKLVNCETLDLVSFIFTENHSIFNYRVSNNASQLAQKLAKLRYPDSEQAVQRDTDFLKQLYDNNIAFFSHHLAHLALSLQISAGQDSESLG